MRDKRINMSIEEAIRLLDPDSTVESLLEFKDYKGITPQHEALTAAVADACRVACACMRVLLTNKVNVDTGKKPVKMTIVVNGKGGSGKDTICDIVGKHYRVKNVSSITIIKKAAEVLGWDGGKKPEDRKFLSDLKRLSNGYNGMPFWDVAREYGLFCKDGREEVLFVHIREPEEIAAFCTYVKNDGRSDITTLLIKSARSDMSFGNMSDDGVDEYPYDHVFCNNCTLEELDERFMEFFEGEILGGGDE